MAVSAASPGQRLLVDMAAWVPSRNGTIAFFNASATGRHLYLYNDFTIPNNSAMVFDGVTVSNGAVFEIGGGTSLNITGNLTVTGNSTIIARGKNRSVQVDGLWQGAGVTISANDIRVDAGSKITADNQGYTQDAGPGNGGGGNCGGTYGGVGGRGPWGLENTNTYGNCVSSDRSRQRRREF